MNNYLGHSISVESLLTVFQQAPVALAFLKGEDFVIQAANPKILEVWGKDESVIGKPLIDGLPELKGQVFIGLLNRVFTTGIPYKGDEASVYLNREGVYGEYFFDFIYAPVYDSEHRQITGVSVVATEVTGKVLAQRKLEESNFRYKELLSNSDYSTAVYRGRDLIIDFANDMMLKTWGKDSSVRGKKLEEALPELKAQPFLDILRNIMNGGKGYSASEDPVDLVVDGELKTYYYNFSYKPLKNSEGEVYAILNVAVDVTEQVQARKQLQESERLLKSFIENVPGAVSIMEGPEYYIRVSNDATATVWGGPSNRIGLPITEAYPGIEKREPYRNLENVRKTKKRISVKNFEIKDSKGRRFISYILQPLLDERGEVGHIISIAYDITEEMITQQKLESNEERFRGLANSMPHFVWTADKEGSVDFFNDKWYEYTGFDRSLKGDESWVKILHPDHLERTVTTWSNSVRTGLAYEIEYLLKDFSRPDKYRWFLGRAVPLHDTDGNIIQWAGTCTDIDEFKKLEKQKDNFLAIASHELKTPLTSLKLYSQFIEKSLRKGGDTRNADVALKMDMQINKLTSLIEELLDVTKIQNGKLELNKSEFDADQLINDVVEEQQMNSRHHISVEKEYLGTVYADPQRISQVMANLISNAIKYSPQDDRIIVKAQRERDMFIFSVRDFGIGIPEDKRQKIFEQYYRVSGAKERTFPGIGLGLYISAEIIKRSNGKIYVKDTDGEGSEVCFEIPAGIPEKAEDEK